MLKKNAQKACAMQDKLDQLRMCYDERLIQFIYSCCYSCVLEFNLVNHKYDMITVLFSYFFNSRHSPPSTFFHVDICVSKFCCFSTKSIRMRNFIFKFLFIIILCKKINDRKIPNDSLKNNVYYFT
jgi:hypothetical protein